MSASIKTFVRTYCAVGIVLSVLAIYQTEQQTQAFLKVRARYSWVAVMLIFILNVAAGVYLLVQPDGLSSFRPKIKFDPSRIAWKLLGLGLFVAAFPLLWIAKYYFFGRAVSGFFPEVWVWWWLALIQAAGFRLFTRASWGAAFTSTLLADGVIFQTYVLFQGLSDYPFSLGWSEASRYYYGSLLFSRSIYGVQLPLSIWHATRYMLLAIPFLMRGLPLWADRLWQALLWLGLTGLTSWSITRRLRLEDREKNLFLLAWLFLYLFQGAVYYHLQICIIIIFLGVSTRHPFRSLIAVIIASFWAGMSRLNWFPVPAMLAVTLYLLEEPTSVARKLWDYFARPLLWSGLGLAAALAGQVFYFFISGNQDLSAFDSSLHSPLLFYRWLPNGTNPLGILLSIVLVSLPLIVLVLWALRRHWIHLYPLRWAGLLAILVVLFVGGLIVSSKIGGGGDLHNMDAFMVALAVIAAYVLVGRVASDIPAKLIPQGVPWPIIVFLLIIPVGFSLSRVLPPIQYDRVEASADLSILGKTVQSYNKSGPVLFIYERHLLTFGMIPNVPILPDYEVIPLMEMAISGNQAYLQRFYLDLQSHRFAAIVATKQNLDSKSGDFAEESALWNRLVAYHLLCEYVPVLTLQSSNIQVYIPRAIPQCPTLPATSASP